jgi:hypothetical protein
MQPQKPTTRSSASKRKQRAAFLRQVSKVEITAGSKTDFVVALPLEASNPDSLGSLLILNRSADAIADLQASLANARCRRTVCSVCGHFADLSRLPVSSSDRLILNRRQIHGMFEARLARLVHTAASLVAIESLEMKCVAQMQSIVSQFFLHGLNQQVPA